MPCSPHILGIGNLVMSHFGAFSITGSYHLLRLQYNLEVIVTSSQHQKSLMNCNKRLQLLGLRLRSMPIQQTIWQLWPTKYERIDSAELSVPIITHFLCSDDLALVTKFVKETQLYKIKKKSGLYLKRFLRYLRIPKNPTLIPYFGPI